MYVAALVPDEGQSSGQQYEGFAPTPDFVIDVREDGFGFLRHDTFKAGFAADLSDAEAAFMRDTQVPVNMSVFAETVSRAAWRDKPSWAVFGTEDKAFDQAMLTHMAERAGAAITTVPGSHAIYVSRPDAVTDVVVAAAEGAHRARSETARRQQMWLTCSQPRVRAFHRSSTQGHSLRSSGGRRRLRLAAQRCASSWASRPVVAAKSRTIRSRSGASSGPGAYATRYTTCMIPPRPAGTHSC